LLPQKQRPAESIYAQKGVTEFGEDVRIETLFQKSKALRSLANVPRNTCGNCVVEGANYEVY
jgi:hypothetical protein